VCNGIPGLIEELHSVHHDHHVLPVDGEVTAHNEDYHTTQKTLFLLPQNPSSESERSIMYQGKHRLIELVSCFQMQSMNSNTCVVR
jgi:hypothetical protein